MKHWGKIPEERDELMSAVSEGKRVSRDSIKRLVGMGSREQVLGADFSMIFLTVDSGTGLKEQNGTPQK